MNREKKNKMLSARYKTTAPTAPTAQQAVLNEWISFGCINTAPSKPSAKRVDMIIMDDVATCKQEKGTAMDTRTEAQQAKDYLITSLRQERQSKIDSEYNAFNLNFIGPKTMKELRDGLKAGFITLPKNEETWEDETRVYSWMDYVIWHDPSKVPDQKGFDAARKLIEKDVSEVQDTIIVFGAEKGLEKLNEFKAKVYH